MTEVASVDSEVLCVTDCAARGDAGPGKIEAVSCVVPVAVIVGC